MKKLTLLLLGAIPLFAIAGGFQVNLQGNKQTGMGHLGTSFHLGASSVFFNPAMMGLGEKKFVVEGGTSFISSSVHFQNSNTGLLEETDNAIGTPFYLYATYKINDKLAAGLGVYTPFGSSLSWGDDWSGRHIVQDISLSAIFFQPTLSYNLTDKLRVGAGLAIVRGSVDITRALPVPIGNSASVNLEGSTIDFGFNAGIHYDINEQLSVGLTHRSLVEVDLDDGDADFTVDPALAASFPDGEFASSLPLPASTTLGLAYTIGEKWLISAEASFVQWDEYESLDFDFANNTPQLQDSENPRNYENSYIYRVGAQYSCNETLDFRIGFYYDESPIQDDFFSPETPNSDNIGISGGLSKYIGERFGFDLSLLYIIGEERDSQSLPDNFGGTYASRLVITGVGLNYNF